MECKPFQFHKTLQILSLFRLTSCRIICDGIKEYFNAMLPSRLLYKEEKSQYSKLMAENADKEPSQIYGCHHLLRLFGKNFLIWF